MKFAFTSELDLLDINNWAQGYIKIGEHQEFIIVDSDYTNFIYLARQTKPGDVQYEDQLMYQAGEAFIAFFIEEEEMPF